MPTSRTRAQPRHSRILLFIACLALGCGGDSLNEPDPNNPQEPNNPPDPNNPDVPTPLPARTDIGTLGGESSYAYDINDDGVVVGAAQTADGAYRAFRWTLAGGLEPLLPLSGDPESRGIAITGDNTVLGISIAEDGSTRPVLWSSDGAAAELAIPSISGAHLTPNDRNAQGTVVGDALFAENADALAHAWVWSPGGGLVDLADQLEVQFESYASAIAEAGQVTGTLGAGLWRAYLWSPQGGARSLGVPGGAPDRTEVTAQGVNGAGQVAGWARLLQPESDVVPPPEPPFPTFGSHAYVWSEAAGFTLLPAFPGDVPSEAVASDLNDRGDVVGSAIRPGRDEINAVAWPRGSAIVPLNGSDPNPSVALAVNRNGVAAGWTSTSAEGADRATVWNIDLAAPLTARVARPERPTLRGRIAPRSGTAACLRRRDLVSKAQLADCVEGRRD
jgi:probable HAF family extracellular repeat protein